MDQSKDVPAHALGSLDDFLERPDRLLQAIQALQDIINAAQSVRRDVFTMIHGGPFNDPESVATALRVTGADGYVTGSTAETTPVRTGVADTIRRFRAGSTSSGRQA